MVLKVILVLVLFGLPLIPTFWAIQDIPKRQFRSFRRKFLWFFAVSTFPFFGALAYILFERKKTEPLDSFASMPGLVKAGEKSRS